MIFFLIATVLSAFAEPVSDSALKQMAEKEISVQPLFTREQSATVTTNEFINQDAGEAPAHWELSLNTQYFTPQGTGRISTGEQYGLSSYGQSQMFGIRGQRWFARPSLFKVRTHYGLGGTIQVNRSKADLVTSSGYRYDGISLSTWLASFGPQAELWLFNGLALGIDAQAGSVVCVQSHRLAEANDTRTPQFYRLGVSLKAYPMDSIFVALGYEYRDTIGQSEDLKLQANNYLLSLGFGL